MRPMNRTISILACLCLFAGCSDNSGGTAGANNAANNGEDAGNNGEDAGNNGDDAGNNDEDAGNNGADAGNNGGGCASDADCFGEQRCISDGRCVGRWDRSCASAADCRPDEECRDLGGAMGCSFPEQPIFVCPSEDERCRDTASQLEAGAAAVAMTPEGFEQPLPEFLDRGIWFTGDPDIIEGDVTFVDCGLDQLCEGDPGYPGPDFGEGDGHMQGAWIAGYDHSRPALRYCPEAEDGRCPADQPWVGEVAHDDVWARTVVLREGEVTVAIVAIDAVGLFYDHHDRVRAKLADGVDIDLLILTSTHVHEAPDAMGQWGPGAAGSDLPVNTGAEPWWLDRIDNKIAESINQAWGQLTPVNIRAAVVDTGVDGLAIGDGRDPWIVDDDFGVMQFTAMDTGDTVATLLNWGNHPEVLDSKNSFITSDYPHYLRTYVENGLPEARRGEELVAEARPGVGGVAIFLAGALGGLIGPGRHMARNRAGEEFSQGSFAKAEAVGGQLAELTFDALADARELTPRLSFATRRITVPVENSQFHTAIYGLKLFDRDVTNVTLDLPFEGDNIPSAFTQLSLVRIGEATFFTMPGEVFPETVVGGYDPKVDYAFTPVLGDPEVIQCGDDLLPMGCGESSDCPSGWSCMQSHRDNPELHNCRPVGDLCDGDDDCDGMTCSDGRCRTACEGDEACAAGFACVDSFCAWDPALALAGGHAYACMVSPGNPNPPDLDAAPTGPYLKERMPGDMIFTLGLGHDELGYIVENYDFKLDPDGPYITEPPGDHYTETNSTGPSHLPLLLTHWAEILEVVE